MSKNRLQILKKLSQKRIKFKIANKSGKIDHWLLIVVLLLCLFGIVMVYDSSVAIAVRDFDDQYHFVREQLRSLGLALIAMIVFMQIDYKKLYNLALPLLLLTIVLLLLVFVPGIGLHLLGARRWIAFGPINIQPSELAKLAIIIYFSAWFSRPEKGRLWSFLLLTGVVVGLIMLQPDLGTSIVISVIAISMYFFSGAPLKEFLFLIPSGITSIILLSVIAPYRMKRLLTFFNPENDPQGASYHIRQALLAIGSGGLFGVGIGQSRQKYAYLPEANTDSIFAVVAEEVGFFGSVFLILVFLFLLWRGFKTAKHISDTFGRYLALGISVWIGMQITINLSAMVALVPLTGIPLPFISYGGTSLLSLMVGIGILLNISKHRQ